MGDQKRPGEITAMLNKWSGGDREALCELLPLFQGELKRLARQYMSGERKDHTLQPTALVNEAFLRLVDQQGVRWQSRAHFLGIAATSMRRILVDHARAKASRKRGFGQRALSLDAALEREHSTFAESPDLSSPESLLALERALGRLETVSHRQSRTVELRYFVGLNNREIAEVLDISVATVKREWTAARVWLYRELSSPSPS